MIIDVHGHLVPPDARAAGPVRVHNDVDVGGSYGVKRGIKHAVLVGYLSRRLGFPVRLVEDRLEASPACNSRIASHASRRKRLEWARVRPVPAPRPRGTTCTILQVVN
jgi:Molybdopterin-binding domain of aldehyde dehydrogenase